MTATATATATKKFKVMIVEDSPLIAADLALILSDAGFDVCEICATADQALHSLFYHKPDLVTLDYDLIGGNCIVFSDVLSTLGIAQMVISGQRLLELKNKIVKTAPIVTKPYHPKHVIRTAHLAIAENTDVSFFENQEASYVA